MDAHIKGLTLSFVASVAAGCAANLEVVPIQALYSDRHCQYEEAGVYPLELQPDGRLTGWKGPPPKDELKLESMPVNGLFYGVSYGTFNTGGYSLELTNDEIVLAEDPVVLPVELNTPGPNEMTTQVITSPCLVVFVETERESLNPVLPLQEE